MKRRATSGKYKESIIALKGAQLIIQEVLTTDRVTGDRLIGRFAILNEKEQIGYEKTGQV